MQELVNKHNLSALGIPGKLEKPRAAHMDHAASTRRERGDSLVGTAENRVIPLNERQSSQELCGGLPARGEVHRQRVPGMIAEVLKHLLALGSGQASSRALQ
jgi:hypothetical protein